MKSLFEKIKPAHLFIGTLLMILGIIMFVGGKSLEMGNDFIILEAVDGSVLVTKNDDKEVSVVNSLFELRAGDIIKTRSDSFALIYFAEDIYLRMDESTEIKIESLHKNSDTFNTSVSLNKGRIWSKIDKSLNANSSYEIKTANSQTKALGTAFGASRKNDIVEYVLTNGKILVKALDPKSQEAVNSEKELDSFSLLTIKDGDITDQKRIPLSFKLNEEDIKKEWIRLNIMEDKEPTANLKITEKINAMKEKRKDLEDEERAIINKNQEWRLDALVEKIRADRAGNMERFKDLGNILNNNLDSKKEDKEKEETATTSEEVSKEPLLVASINPREIVGDGYNLYSNIYISGSGFKGVNEISLDEIILEDFTVISDNKIRVAIPGSIKHGTYTLIIIRKDEKSATLIDALKVIKPVINEEEADTRNENF